MKRLSPFFLCLLVAVGLQLAASNVFATPIGTSATLLGTQVSGTMLIPSLNPTMNFFDRNNGYVPAGYSNFSGTTVSISNSATEFGFQSGVDSSTANFTGSLLTLTGVLGNSSAPAIQYRFTSLTPGAFASIVLVSTNLPSLTFSVIGNTIIINEGVITHTGTYTTIFALSGPATGIPDAGSTVLLLGMGVAVLLLATSRIAPLALSHARS